MVNLSFDSKIFFNLPIDNRWSLYHLNQLQSVDLNQVTRPIFIARSGYLFDRQMPINSNKKNVLTYQINSWSYFSSHRVMRYLGPDHAPDDLPDIVLLHRI